KPLVAIGDCVAQPARLLPGRPDNPRQRPGERGVPYLPPPWLPRMAKRLRPPRRRRGAHGRTRTVAQVYGPRSTPVSAVRIGRRPLDRLGSEGRSGSDGRSGPDGAGQPVAVHLGRAWERHRVVGGNPIG